MKKYLILIISYTLVALIATSWAQSKLSEERSMDFEAQSINVKGIVLEIDGSQHEIEVKSGPDKGEIVEVEHFYSDSVYDIEVEEGDKVFLYGATDPTIDETNYQYYIQDYYHLDSLIWIGIIFILLTIILGGKYGLKAITSLGLSLVMIFGVLIPLAKIGYNPMLLAIVIGIITALFAIHIIQGVNLESLTAFIGTAGGLIFAGIIAVITAKLANLTGLSTEDSRLLAIYWPDLKYQGLLLSGIMIGALGAIMDVSVSISAALIELKKHKPKISSSELFHSGINVGKNIMGSMINTLVFAYVGASLTIVMLFYGSNTSLIEILNYGFISEEIARSLVGSFSLLMTIPLTAIVGSVILSKKNYK